MADKNIKEGDQVSWQWSGGRPGGTAVEVKGKGEISVQSMKGNTIKKNASPDNPGVHVSRQGNDVVKRASELDKEGEGKAFKEAHKNGHGHSHGGAGEKHGRDEHTHEKNGDAKADGADGPDAKKQKTGTDHAANGHGKKAAGKGRPKKDNGPAKPKGERKAAKPKKERPPPNPESIGSRTRSRAKA